MNILAIRPGMLDRRFVTFPGIDWNIPVIFPGTLASALPILPGIEPKKERTLENAPGIDLKVFLMWFIAFMIVVLTVLKTELTPFLNHSNLLYMTTTAATSAAIAMTTIAIGFALSAAFRSH